MCVKHAEKNLNTKNKLDVVAGFLRRLGHAVRNWVFSDWNARTSHMADGCRSEYEVLDDEAEANSWDGCETTAECKYT